MKTNETITPAQFVEKWLPWYDERFAALIHGHDLTEDELVSERFMFGEENIGEALAAFEAHIRQETWREACEAMRKVCADIVLDLENGGYCEVRTTYGSVEYAEIPEIPKNQ